jgi:hypothetical protein
LLASIAFSATAAEDKLYWERVFPVNADVNFELDTHKGIIRLDHANVSEITVKATYYFDNDQDPEMLQYLEFKTRANADSVYVDTEFDPPKKGSSGWWTQGVSHPFIEFDILVPSNASIELESHKAEFDVEAPAGEVEIESHKGTGEIRNVRNNLEIESHKGRFKIEITELNDIEIESHKGDIEVTINNARNFTVVGTSHKGDLRFQGRDIPVTTEDKETYVDYKEGTGTHNIELDTHKGQLTLIFKN